MKKNNMKKTENKVVYFVGASGQAYPFTLYPLHADLPDIGAVYIFTRVENGLYISYEPLYIGETGRLTSCLQNYEKWVCVSRRFVNSICVYFENDAASRLRMARDLIDQQDPPCNR